MSLISDIFGVAKDSKGIIDDIKTAKNNAKGVANRVLSESEFNMKLVLEHYLKNDVPGDKIIEKLKFNHLQEALNNGFNFSKIKKGKISKELTDSSGFYKNYEGWDCEELMKSIRSAIEQLYLVAELYDIKYSKKVSVRRRLINLGKRYLLLTHFIHEK
jgi:hypothetical protein